MKKPPCPEVGHDASNEPSGSLGTSPATRCPVWASAAGLVPAGQPRQTLRAVSAPRPGVPDSARAPASLWCLAAVFAVGACAGVWWLWWTFRLMSFDVAFYQQAFWLALRGEWHGSLLDVSLMGNHAEPLAFVLLPLYAVLPHAMTPVAAQALLLATMPSTAWRICGALGLGREPSVAMAACTLLMPAAGFAAIHEFHPETLSAPLWLLLFEARLRGRAGWHALWFFAVLACKENMAPPLVVYCVVCALRDRARGWQWQAAWSVVPAAVAIAWLAACSAWIMPALNGGKVDYFALYAHLTDGRGGLFSAVLSDPGRVFGHLRRSVPGSSLVWCSFAPLLFLTWLRPAWVLVAAPLFAQHLLSWRTSEWTIHLHYGVPLLAICWIGAAEALCGKRWASMAAVGCVLACCAAQAWVGPARSLPRIVGDPVSLIESREIKAGLLAAIPEDADVVAGIPYLSHLAHRRGLHSLHHVLKGTRTLSRERYVPPSGVDFVLVDYGDSETFDPVAGYFHSAAKGRDGSELPSSERLLADFLVPHAWRVRQINSVCLMKRIGPAEAGGESVEGEPILDRGTRLVGRVEAQREGERGALLRMRFAVEGVRSRIPWATLRLEGNGIEERIELGLAVPWLEAGVGEQGFRVRVPTVVPEGDYRVTLLFSDRSRIVWRERVRGVAAEGRTVGMPLGRWRVGGVTDPG